MTRYLTNNAFALLTAGSALVWLGAWVTGLCLDPGSWPVRYTLFGIGFLVSTHIALAWMWKLALEQRSAIRFIDQLTRTDPTESAGELENCDLPSLQPNNAWYDVACRLEASYADLLRRTYEAEHARAALEVRAQRMATLYEQVQAVLDGLAEPVVAINNLDEVVLANTSAEKLFNFDLDKVEQRSAENLLHCEALLDLLTNSRQRTGSARRIGEVRLGDEDSDDWYRVTTNGMSGQRKSSGGRDDVHGAVAVLRDIRGDKAAQKRHAEFVSAVSHEMKTPLAGIKAYVELLADDDAQDDEAREEFLSVINSQANRMERLIDNLLNLARIEAGVVKVDKQPRSLNEILEEAVRVTTPAAEAKKMQLQADLSPMYLGVLADRDLLLQAAINLLSNAIKYTPEQGQVNLRSRLRGNDAVFEVSDTGVGLSEDDCQRVFDKFYRVKDQRNMAEGTGLGLPLARHIVEDVHGGHLTVESELGVGSTFTVAIPSTVHGT